MKVDFGEDLFVTDMTITYLRFLGSLVPPPFGLGPFGPVVYLG